MVILILLNASVVFGQNAMLESLTKGAHMGLSVLDESCFIQGFLSYKEKKETLEKSKGGISSEFKSKIEAKMWNLEELQWMVEIDKR